MLIENKLECLSLAFFGLVYHLQSPFEALPSWVDTWAIIRLGSKGLLGTNSLAAGLNKLGSLPLAIFSGYYNISVTVHSTGAILLAGRLLALPAKIGQAWKNLLRTNGLAYLTLSSEMKKKKFHNIDTRSNSLNLVSYIKTLNCTKLARFSTFYSTKKKYWQY